MSEPTLVDRIICAAALAWKDDGEVLATGIGIVPRLAASLCMASINRDLMMTDSEAWIVQEPVPIGPIGPARRLPDSARKPHGLCAHLRQRLGRQAPRDGRPDADRPLRPGQHLDDRQRLPRPKSMMLGVRGFPGNSINHANSFFVPNHSPKVFVAGEVDMVASAGYNAARLARGWTLDEIDIRLLVTNLCVMDFGGPGHQVRLKSLHPGVTADQVQQATGFELQIDADLPETPAPTADQLALLARLDPHNLRATALGA
jgi:glutaconate CoA-transferase subunit B